MSRSWIDSLRRSGRSGVTAGVDIGRNAVRYVEIDTKSGGSEVRAANSVRLDAALFEGEPTPQSARMIADAVAQVASEARNRYLPVHVSIPDPMTRMALFELEELPKSGAARTALVQFRLQKELPAQEWEYRAEGLGTLSSGKHLLLGMAMSSAWRRTLVEALHARGIIAWSLSSRLPRLLNALETRLSGGSGALVSVTEDSWALAALDSQGRVRYVRSQWRTAGLTAAAMAAEAQRAILAYVHQDGERTIETIRVFAQSADTDLATEIEARSDGACQRLTTAELAADLPADPALLEYASALAAALQ